MAADNVVPDGNVEAEIARGEQDDILQDYPISTKARKAKEQDKRVVRPKALPPKTMKRDISQTASQSASVRIMELSRPTKKHVLTTLRTKGSLLSPMLVDNLIKIIEVESCLTPEEAAQVLRQRKGRATRVIRPAMSTKGRSQRKIAKEDTPKATTFDKDATMCQYLIAECFVKSILGYQCQSQKKDIRDIAQVILKRLTSLDNYVDARSDDRTTQQLHLLADVVACWIAEVLIEVADTRKEALKEYCEKRQIKMLEVDDVDDEETTGKTETEEEQTEEKDNPGHERKHGKRDEETEEIKGIVESRDTEESEDTGNKTATAEET